MSDKGGGSAATRTRSKARVMQEMDANATTGGPKLPPSSAQTMSKIQSRCVRLVVDSRRIKTHRFRITKKDRRLGGVVGGGPLGQCIFVKNLERTFFNTPLPNGRFFRIIFSLNHHLRGGRRPFSQKKRTSVRDDR